MTSQAADGDSAGGSRRGAANGLRLVVVALLALTLGWAVAPRGALPLYDGVGFPDEPYRFVQRPAGAPDTKGPTTARGSATVSNGRTGSVIANSAEQAPQVSVQIPPAGLVVPAGTSKVTLIAEPTKPLPTTSGQYLWSNVYDLTTEPGAELHKVSLQATITLRAATAQRPAPHIARYAAGHWTMLPTFADGRDVYVAELSGLGRYAVVGTTPLDVSQLRGATGSGSTGDGGGSNAVGIVVGVGALVLVVGLFLLGRWRRARTALADEDAG
jgi:hypothetical protein